MKYFDELPKEKRFLLLMQKGSFIGTINYYNQKIDLYNIEGEYVEVIYTPDTMMVYRIALAERCRLHLYSIIKSVDNI